MKGRRVASSKVRRWFRAIPLYLCLVTALLSACGQQPGKKGPCDGLVYKEFGLSRQEFLPCAGEMIATMDRLRPQLEVSLRGDRNARTKARATFGELEALLRKAGGRNVLERWQDTSLNDLNIAIWNAYSSYQTFLMIPVITEGKLGAAQVQAGLEDEYSKGRDAQERARAIYESLR